MNNKGVLVISLDTELAWGRINDPTRLAYHPEYRQGKSIIRDLLILFDKYTAPVTWALVGRLIDEKGLELNLNEFYKPLTIEEIREDKELHSDTESVLFDSSLLQTIQSAKVKHEVASHSYGHVLFEDIEKSGIETLARKDIQRQNNLFSEHNLVPRTIVFPQNKIGCLEAFASHGYKVFRGVTKSHSGSLLPIPTKVKRQVEMLIPLTPCCVVPERHPTGMIELKTSLIYRIPSQGVKRFCSVKNMTKRAKIGIKKAADKSEIFHLFFHPFNFAFRRKEHFEGLEEVLRFANEMCKKNKLEILPMSDAVRRSINFEER